MLKPYEFFDKNELVEIFKKNIPAYFVEKELAYFEDYLDKFPTTYFSILNEDKIVGGIGFQISEDGKIGSITWIFLDPKFSKIGLGKSSVVRCIELMKEKGHVNKVMVRTSQFAHLFFGKLGFKLKQVKQDYWAVGFDLYEMEKEI